MGHKYYHYSTISTFVHSSCLSKSAHHTRPCIRTKTHFQIVMFSLNWKFSNMDIINYLNVRIMFADITISQSHLLADNTDSCSARKIDSNNCQRTNSCEKIWYNNKKLEVYFTYSIQFRAIVAYFISGRGRSVEICGVIKK